MNLKQWAERQGVSYATARRWFAAGTLPVQARRVGGLVLDARAEGDPEDQGDNHEPDDRGSANQTALYTQVTADQIGTASGLFRTFGYIGSIASSALISIVFHTSVTDHGLHVIALIMVVVSALGLVIVLADRTIMSQARAGRGPSASSPVPAEKGVPAHSSPKPPATQRETRWHSPSSTPRPRSS